MNDLLGILNDLSMAVKVGWIVWLVWCFGQVVWYRRFVRQPALPQAVQEAMRRKSSGGRRPIARRPDADMWEAPGSGSSKKHDLLATLGLGNSSAVDQTR